MPVLRSLLLFLVVSIVAAIPALAGPNYELQKNTKEISLKGLDLSSQKGAEIAFERIEAAARKVCPHNQFVERHPAPTRSYCMSNAIENTIKSENAPN